MSDEGTLTVTGSTTGPTGPNGNGGGIGSNRADDLTSVTDVALYALKKRLDEVTASLVVRMMLDNEGLVNNIYFDTNGIPTVGVGYNLHDLSGALGLSFQKTTRIHRHDDDYLQTVSATDGEIESAYNYARSVSLTTKSYSDKLTAYRQSNIFLNNIFVGQLLAKTVGDTVNELSGVFSDFGSYPSSAKVALIDMDFNLGLPRFQNFHKLIAAVKANDWDTAAEESHRIGVGAERNAKTAALFQAAKKGE